MRGESKKQFKEAKSGRIGPSCQSPNFATEPREGADLFAASERTERLAEGCHIVEKASRNLRLKRKLRVNRRLVSRPNALAR